MLIDWFTVTAQAINFLILVYFLKRFLYQPIINAIDAREQQLAKTLADAENSKTQAAIERETFERNNELFAQQRNALLIKASQEAEIEKQRLIELARLEADKVLVQRQQSLMQQHLVLNETIKQRIQSEVLATTKKLLSDLANSNLEAQIIEVFLQRLQQLSPQQLQQLNSKGELLICSAFALSAQQQQLISQTLKQLIAGIDEVQFIINPLLITGIELSINGQKLAWSINDYLSGLDISIAQLTGVQ
jgi:F-type H+-transporting ATPase subunit b